MDTACHSELRRRTVVAGALALASLGLAIAEERPMSVTPATSSAVTPPLDATDTVPSPPASPSPGAPGDFDFLTGEWRIHHFWRPSTDAAWVTFHGEATCWGILGGLVSVEELRIPARNFSGMGLRALDVEQRRWMDHWVNARSGVLAREGTSGSFENGVGIFIGDEVDNGNAIRAGGLWDRITPAACRWRQVVSRDGGQTWQHTWVMHWTRL